MNKEMLKLFLGTMAITAVAVITLIILL